jgi:hypothetical protein
MVTRQLPAGRQPLQFRGTISGSDALSLSAAGTVNIGVSEHAYANFMRPAPLPLTWAGAAVFSGEHVPSRAKHKQLTRFAVGKPWHAMMVVTLLVHWALVAQARTHARTHGTRQAHSYKI